MEAIVLAGGLGTRLQNVVAELPKAMANICGEPFLNYQLRYLKENGVKKFILAVGFRHEYITNYYGDNFEGTPLVYSIESEPLGTGGAIKKAMAYCSDDHPLVVNGDTMMMADIRSMHQNHMKRNATISLCLKELIDYDRYGTVLIEDDIKISAFQEKKFTPKGLINAGLYFLDKNWFLQIVSENKFSFEHNILEKLVKEEKFFGFLSDAYFIDIGIPEDFNKAQTDFTSLYSKNIDSNTILFLDRDGVLNKKKEGDYVKSKVEFEFIQGSLDALKSLAAVFKHIFVVTNQQGVGKGIMSLVDLEAVHSHMTSTIEQHGGRIDKIYFAPDLASYTNQFRKPNIGMALLAQQEFPEIDLKNSVMIGDSDSDILFGKNIGAYNIRIADTYDKQANKTFTSLIEVANFFDIKN